MFLVKNHMILTEKIQTSWETSSATMKVSTRWTFLEMNSPCKKKKKKTRELKYNNHSGLNFAVKNLHSTSKILLIHYLLHFHLIQIHCHANGLHQIPTHCHENDLQFLLIHLGSNWHLWKNDWFTITWYFWYLIRIL
jgi:hypothetical protein